MYGWRARVGLIIPADNTVMEPELYGLDLPGISFHVARLTTWKRDEMPACGISLAPLFREMGVDAVVYACAETGASTRETASRASSPSSGTWPP